MHPTSGLEEGVRKAAGPLGKGPQLLGQGGGELFPEPDRQCCQAIRAQPRVLLIPHSGVFHFLRSGHLVATRSRPYYGSYVSCPAAWTSLLKAGAHSVDLWWRMKGCLRQASFARSRNPQKRLKLRWVIGSRPGKPVTTAAHLTSP